MTKVAKKLQRWVAPVCKIPRSLSRCSSDSEKGKTFDIVHPGTCTVVPNLGSMTELPGEPKQKDMLDPLNQSLLGAEGRVQASLMIKKLPR